MVKQRIKSKLASLIKRLSGMNENIPGRSPFPFIQNINKDLCLSQQKNVLISYITTPFQKSLDEKNYHTNQKEAVQILKVFIQLGFSVDICHCLDQHYLAEIKEKKYDLIFGLGEPFVTACISNPEAVKIMYSAEAYPEFVQQKEAERLSYYYERHGKKITSSRHGKFYLPEHFTFAQYLIFKGNKETQKTFQGLQNIRSFLPIAPSPFININYQLTQRESSKSSKSFVWFGSFGAIHKGLDLLIDVFNQKPELTLHVCGLWNEEIELLPPMKSNIINHEFVDTTSSEFIEIINSSSYVILPTCSEGMSSGVLTCMSHGLIPLVSRASGIDLEDEQLYLEDFHLKYLEDKIIEASTMEIKQIDFLHNKIYSETRKKYHLKNFTETFHHHIAECLKTSQEKTK